MSPSTSLGAGPLAPLGTSRLSETFSRIRANGSPGLVTYITAGDPDLPRTEGVIAALDRAGIGWKDLGLIEIHEAFAAQVLSNAQAWASKAWAEKLGRAEPVGVVDRERLNVSGGSIALGHPFGATGARVTTTLARELKRRDATFGLLSVCAQGGMGFAMVLER